MLPLKDTHLEVKTVGAEVLVHDARLGKIHVLNATGGRVLELCDGTRTSNLIARELAAETGHDVTAIDRDVTAILAEFSTLGLVANVA